MAGDPRRRRMPLRGRVIAGALLIATVGITATRTVASPRSESPTAEESGCPPDPGAAVAPAPAELTVTYHGVSTLMFSDGHDRLLVDGFFSRPRTARMLLLPIDSDPGSVTAGLGPDVAPVRAILTAHAHHDHALDTAAIAGKQTLAVVVGTPSVARLVRARGVPSERVCVPAEDAPMVFGPYKVRAFYVRHGPSPFYLRWLLDHPLKRTLSGAAWFGSYKDDENLSYLIEHGDRRILVHPSAGPLPATVEASTVFLGMGRVGKMAASDARDYWRATVGREATTVVPIHWDRFTTPLGHSLIPNPEPLDNVEEGRRRICRYAAERPYIQVSRMESGSVLSFPAGGAPRGSPGVTDYCN